MLAILFAIIILVWGSRTIVGYKYIYTNEPAVGEFEDLDDAMEYAELRKTGWKGGVNEYYKWKEEE